VVICIPSSPCTSGVPTRERPAGSTTRQAYDLLATGFGPGFNGPLQVVGSIHNAKDEAVMVALDQKLQGKPDIARRGAPADLQERPGRRYLRRAEVQPRFEGHRKSDRDNSQRLHTAVTTTTHTGIYVGGLTAIFVDFPRSSRPRSRCSSGHRPARGLLLMVGVPEHRHTLDRRRDEHLRGRGVFWSRRGGLSVGLG